MEWLEKRKIGEKEINCIEEKKNKLLNLVQQGYNSTTTMK